MSIFAKPNSQQVFGTIQQAERCANNVKVEYRRTSVFDPSLDKNNWPRSGFSQNGNYFISDGGSINPAEWFEDIETFTVGMRSHYSIVGQTVDSAGAPMSAVTLEAYRTSDDTKQGDCVSNAIGEYTLPTQTTGNHYVRGYKVGGAFNFGGTTDENLIPV